MGAPELVVFIGLQASGKSSFYRAHFAQTHAHVSKDLMPPSARNKDARQERLIREALAEGRSVVVNNTNPGRVQRAPLIAIAREMQASVRGYYFASRLQDCLKRNEGRVGRAHVPAVGIFTTAKRLERPSLAEGFDQLVHVRLTEHGFEVRPWQEGPAR